jgi:zinc transporter ZupT
MIGSNLLLIAAVGLGVILALFFKAQGLKNLKWLLTFSGAYLLGIGVFHLLPEIFETHSHHYGVLIMAGFFVQLLLEALSKGLEHGHAHKELFQNKGLPFGVIFSLFLHALLESLPIGGHQHELSRNALLMGLFVHKIPVTIILCTMLMEFTQKWWSLALWLTLFALMAPIGVWLGGSLDFLQAYSQEMMAFVFGIFLHISTTILFEGNQSHRFNYIKLLTILVSLVLAWLSVSH